MTDEETEGCVVCGAMVADDLKHLAWHRRNGDVTRCRSTVKHDDVDYQCRLDYQHEGDHGARLPDGLELTWGIEVGGVW